MRHLVIYLTLLFSAAQAFACGHAYHAKIFPVGMVGDTLVAVDIIVHRYDYFPQDSEGNFYGIGGLIYDLTAYINKYDSSQKLLSSVVIDSLEAKENYLSAIKEIYKKSFDSVTANCKNIQLIKPVDIEVCAYDSICQGIQIEKDQIASYNGKEYKLHALVPSNWEYFPLAITEDEMFDDEDGNIFHRAMNLSTISSVRKFEYANNQTLIILHLVAQSILEEMAPYYAKGNKQKRKRISDIKKVAYEEPMPHHGYGVDIFFIAD